MQVSRNDHVNQILKEKLERQPSCLAIPSEKRLLNESLLIKVIRGPHVLPTPNSMLNRLRLSRIGTREPYVLFVNIQAPMI